MDFLMFVYIQVVVWRALAIKGSVAQPTTIFCCLFISEKARASRSALSSHCYWTPSCSANDWQLGWLQFHSQSSILTKPKGKEFCMEC